MSIKNLIGFVIVLLQQPLGQITTKAWRKLLKVGR